MIPEFGRDLFVRMIISQKGLSQKACNEAG